jgi:hypothetical protein
VDAASGSPWFNLKLSFNLMWCLTWSDVVEHCCNHHVWFLLYKYELVSWSTFCRRGARHRCPNQLVSMQCYFHTCTVRLQEGASCGIADMMV